MPNEEKLMCSQCGSEFTSQQQLDRHNSDQHGRGQQTQAGQQYAQE
jgi:uncharacterized C2H2 Zn-finger protein